MTTKIIEVTNAERNWGKFMLLRPDEEWDRKALITGEPSDVPLLRICGWSRKFLWVLDLQTGEGIYISPAGNARADLEKHQVWVCPMFEPFLEWLYAQALDDLQALPDVLDLPEAEFRLYGYRRGQEKWANLSVDTHGNVLGSQLYASREEADQWFGKSARVHRLGNQAQRIQMAADELVGHTTRRSNGKHL